MDHRDAQIAEVTLIIRDPYGNDLDPVVEKLKSMGMEVREVDRDDGVIEGTVQLSAVPRIQELPEVQTVRIDFSYIADYPTGDPRDLDAPEKTA